jgi:membrane-associated HD superfamily phosphohydrolase
MRVLLLVNILPGNADRMEIEMAAESVGRITIVMIEEDMVVIEAGMVVIEEDMVVIEEDMVVIEEDMEATVEVDTEVIAEWIVVQTAHYQQIDRWSQHLASTLETYFSMSLPLISSESSRHLAMSSLPSLPPMLEG